MSRRTVYWRKQIVLGKNADETATAITNRCNGGVGRKGYRNDRHCQSVEHSKLHRNTQWKASTKPMSEDKAARLARALHRTRS